MNSGGTTEDTEDSVQRSDIMFTVVWVSFCFFFLLMPFCSNAKKRKLCMRRIRERRWIREEDDDDWYTQMMRERLARRQQELAEFHTLEINKTQGDEIREQYILKLLEKYTLVRLWNKNSCCI